MRGGGEDFDNLPKLGGKGQRGEGSCCTLDARLVRICLVKKPRNISQSSSSGLWAHLLFFSENELKQQKGRKVNSLISHMVEEWCLFLVITFRFCWGQMSPLSPLWTKRFRVASSEEDDTKEPFQNRIWPGNVLHPPQCLWYWCNSSLTWAEFSGGNPDLLAVIAWLEIPIPLLSYLSPGTCKRLEPKQNEFGIFEAPTVPPGMKQEWEQGKQDNVTWRGAETHLY